MGVSERGRCEEWIYEERKIMGGRGKEYRGDLGV
jgi:hypothetical protein